MGVGGGDNAWFAKDLPLLIAFAVLAAYTYSCGLRAPALIAFVKDGLIYLVIIVAIIYLPEQARRLGRDLRRRAGEDGSHDQRRSTGKPRGVLHPGDGASGPTPRWRWARRWRCSCTRTRSRRVLSRKNRNVIRRNAAILPPYSFMLGLLALLGFVAIAAGDQADRAGRQAERPAGRSRSCSRTCSRSWFAGVAFAAIAIGALVPAAIMSIAAANLFTRNIYKDFLKPDATPAQEAKVSKLVSLVVKVGALVFVLTLDKPNAINFQLLGGIWILQTFPAIVFGLYTRWFHRWALLAGWAVGMVYGTLAAYGVANPATGKPLRRLARGDPVHRRDRLHRADRLRPQRRRRGRADLRAARPQGADGDDETIPATTTPTPGTRGHRHARRGAGHRTGSPLAAERSRGHDRDRPPGPCRRPRPGRGTHRRGLRRGRLRHRGRRVRPSTCGTRRPAPARRRSMSPPCPAVPTRSQGPSRSAPRDLPGAKSRARARVSSGCSPWHPRHVARGSPRPW